MINSNDTDVLLQRISASDPTALDQLYGRYGDRLRKMIKLRLDQRLQGKVNPSEIIRQATMEAARRLSEYTRSPGDRFYLWLRQLAGDILRDTQGRILNTRSGQVMSDVSLVRGALPAATSLALAEQLLGRLSQSKAITQRVELQLQVQEALNDLDAIDREILVLRHFENLSNSETAHVLDIKEGVASKRFISALKELMQRLSAIPGFREPM